MIPELGHFLLTLAAISALFGAGVVYWGILTGNRLRSGLWRLTTPIATASLTISAATLVYAFLTDDFSVRYVADHSNTQLETIYKFAALWGSHEGSMLLWVVLIAWWALVAGLVDTLRTHDEKLMDKIQCVMLFIVGLFSAFLLATSNPFIRNLPMVPPEGRDLNPILQDIGMILHPPVLFMGYAGLALCFASALALLWKGEWSKTALRFCTVSVIITWIFLTAGNALGSWWAYTELGWGGWWFWDPVENASFIPWLGTSALLHALLMARYKGEMKRLCVALMLVCFAFCLLGTFIVRSGVMASVHAFASDPNRGVAILAVSLLVLVPAVILYCLRIDGVCQKSEAQLTDADILMTAGVYLLVVATVAVLIGTVYPLFHDMLGLGSLTVGAPYFNSFFAPMTIIASVMIGVVQAMRLKRFWPALLCATLAVVGAIAAVYLTEPRDRWMTLAGFAGAFWILLTAFTNFFAGQNKMTGAALIAHVAVAVCMVGATGSTQYEQEALVRMAPGMGRPMADVVFVHTDTYKVNTHAYFGDAARIEVLNAKDESLETVLFPMRQTFISTGMQMSAAGIRHGLWRDYYVSMGNQLSTTEWLVRLSIKPLVSWLWLGAALMMISGVLVLVRRRTKFDSNSEAAQ